MWKGGIFVTSALSVEFGREIRSLPFSNIVIETILNDLGETIGFYLLDFRISHLAYTDDINLMPFDVAPNHY